MEFGKYIAHRGLHDEQAPENSLPAFEKAVEKGISAELDVRLTKDCRLIVLHDRSLMRMCGVEGNADDYTYEQLCAFNLDESDEKIPLLTDVLKVVDGKISLLIEIKYGYPYGTLESRLYHIMKKYKGKYAVQSFNPLSLLWFRIHAGEVSRGQLISTFKKKLDREYILRTISAKPLIYRLISKPEFIACDLRSVSLEVAFQAVDCNADLFTWTANSPELFETAIQFSKTVIGENFPENFVFSGTSEVANEDK